MSHCIFAQPKRISIWQADQRIMKRQKQAINAAKNGDRVLSSCEHQPLNKEEAAAAGAAISTVACIPLRNGAIIGNALQGRAIVQWWNSNLSR